MQKLGFVLIVGLVLSGAPSGALAKRHHAEPDVAAASAVAASSADDSQKKYMEDLQLSAGYLAAASQTQSNVAGLLGGLITFFGIFVTLLSIGVYSFMRNEVKKAVNQGIKEGVEHKLNEAVDYHNLNSMRLNARLLGSLHRMARDLCGTTSDTVKGEIAQAGYDLTNKAEAEAFVERLSTILLTPLHIFGIVHEIAASDQNSKHVGQLVQTLFSEVKAKTVDPINMRPVVQSLIGLLEANHSHSPALPKLKVLQGLLNDVIDGTIPDLPAEPGF